MYTLEFSCYNRPVDPWRTIEILNNLRKERVMGDKSPKNTQKQNKQKDAKKKPK
jgi:hypothetical protein